MTQKRYKTKIIALLLVLVFFASFLVGCNLVNTNNREDMQQVVADVNLQQDTNALKDAFTILGIEQAKLDESINKLNGLQLKNTTIIKRDLLTSYLSYGYQQVNSLGIETVINNIMTNLTNSRLNLQLAMLYYLSQEKIIIDSTVYKTTGDNNYEALTNTQSTQLEMKENAFKYNQFTVAQFNQAINSTTTTDATRKHLETLANSYKFFLTERENNYILNAVNTSINEAIDRYEKVLLQLETNTSSENRTVPTGANQTNLYNVDKSVEIYTGLTGAVPYGYTPLPGSNSVTRSRAYAQFVASLVNNGLIERGENFADIQSLNYYLIECITQYENLLTTKFTATIATQQTTIKEGVKQEYQQLQNIQKLQTGQEFVSTMDALTDTSAIVATPEGKYGYIYNLLLPFSATQSAELNGYTDKTSVDYYKKRNDLAKNIVAMDQRSSWITGSTNYSFNANTVKTTYANKMKATTGTDNYFKSPSMAQSSEYYLFFDENFGEVGRAEGLMRYAGLYPFNGTVVDNKDGTYYVNANRIPIEKFMKDEFEGYLKFILGDNAITTKSWNWNQTYTQKGKYDFAVVYQNSLVGLNGSFYAGDTLYDTNYKALSAVNELIFAYSTDTGSFNKPYGYGMSATGSTSYVPEFEYAGKKLLNPENSQNAAVGSYSAVVTDYGVHIMYLSRFFMRDTIVSTPTTGGIDEYNEEEIGKVGTFSNFFYNATVNKVIGTFNSGIRGQYMEKLNTKSTVKLYKNRYKDLYGR